MAENLTADFINSSSVALSWSHPQNIFNEPSFNYSISAMVIGSEEYAIRENFILFNSSEVPWIVIDVSSIGVCETLNFTLSLAGDCREIYTLLPVSICKYTLQLYTLTFIKMTM